MAAVAAAERPAPVITSFTPDNGPVTTLTVTITGTSFGATQGTSTVKFFDDLEATVADGDWTDTQIKCTVPAGATTGKISVTTGGGTSTSGSDFTVQEFNMSLTNGPVATEVTLTGAGFGALQGLGGSVTFNLVAASAYVSWSDTEIKCTVGAGTTTGKIVATPDGGIAQTSVIDFTIQDFSMSTCEWRCRD